jgi:hypothetical protein
VRRGDSGIGVIMPPARTGGGAEPRWRRGRARANVGYVVEIAGEGGAVPVALIEHGYRASQRYPVVFVLNGVSPQMVDLVLDPIVPQLPLNIPGVVYVDIGDEERVREALLSAQAILTSTEAFRRLATCLGVADDPTDAIAHHPFGFLDAPQATPDFNGPWDGLRQ